MQDPIEIEKTDKKKEARVPAAILLGTVFFICIFFGNMTTVSLLIAIIILGAYEISRMLDKNPSRWSSYLHIGLAVTPVIILKYFDIDGSLFTSMVLMSCLFMTILILNLWFGGRLPYEKGKYLMSLMYWGLPFGLGAHHLMTGDEHAYLSVLAIILLIWTSDTMAYLAGKRYGKHKLMPSVSPGKTMEGSLAAGVSSILLALLFGFLLGHSIKDWLLLGVMIWVFGTWGDLVESKLKRAIGVKDSGKLLRGHGGILDRFDSLVMVIPFLLYVFYCMNK